MGVTDDAVLAAIVEATVDLALVLDDAGTIVWQRRSETRRPEASDEVVVGLNVVDRIHPEDLPEVLDGLARLQTTEATEVRISCRAFDGDDPSLVHRAEVQGWDARDTPGIEGILVVATVQGSRHVLPADAGAGDFSLAEASPLGLAVVSARGDVPFANSLFRARVGAGPTAPVPLDSLPGLEALVEAARHEGADQRSVFHEGAALRLTGRRLDGPGGDVVVSVDDITAEVEAVAARTRSEQTFRATFDHTPAGIALVDPEGIFVEVNAAWTAITGYPSEELVGRTFATITHPDDLPADEALVAEALAGGRDTYRMEKRYVHRSGRTIWVDLRVAAVRAATGEVEHFVSQVLDITADKQAVADMEARERHLTHQATHDHLTGLPNRALLEEHLRLAIDRVAQGQRAASVLLMDLDGFKPVNDTYGHPQGDLVLTELAGRLSGACRRGDIVARLGGDEFVAVVDPASDGDDGHHLAERLLAVVAAPLDALPDGAPPLSASIGITAARADDTVESLLARADEATYRAKARGGATVAVHGADDA
ncbi:diguanylate cyclase [Iamia majanohamensis]|uniref:Diguanylate cyclase n=1 Tax=Iamia majanohamensis TaxID=467976 RepID=A0AAF0BWT4_9ACTN|nr:diguanylate cyclase [Iamia majanohamensis]WCO68453.1 diguanylate cyclase [Iamia majanohamensis]